MSAINAFPFFRKVEEAGISDAFYSHAYTDATVEVKGTATSFEVEIQGCLDKEEENWITLCLVDESDYETLNKVTAAGLYSFSAMGKGIRVKINSISGGYLTIVGKFLY